MWNGRKLSSLRFLLVSFCVVVLSLALQPASSWVTTGQTPCVDYPCGDTSGASRVYSGGAASGGRVLNMGSTATGGVVAIGLFGPASGAVLNISNLMTAPSALRDATKSDLTSSVPGCNANTLDNPVRMFGTIPIVSPTKSIGLLSVTMSQLLFAGCNNPYSGPLHGTYADGFMISCSAHYSGDVAAIDGVTLYADYYDRLYSLPEGGYQQSPVQHHHLPSTILQPDAMGNVSFQFPLADWASQDPHNNVVACAAALSTSTIQQIPQAWASVFTPIS
jgi:hypothetical protein